MLFPMLQLISSSMINQYISPCWKGMQDHWRWSQFLKPRWQPRQEMQLLLVPHGELYQNTTQKNLYQPSSPSKLKNQLKSPMMVSIPVLSDICGCLLFLSNFESQNNEAIWFCFYLSTEEKKCWVTTKVLTWTALLLAGTIYEFLVRWSSNNLTSSSIPIS